MTLTNNVVELPPILGEITTSAVSNGRCTATADSQRWADILFQPNDILEIRLLPPREMFHDAEHGKYRWGPTKRHISFGAFVRAKQLGTLNDQLAEFNSRTETIWEKDDQLENITSRVNIYCSANPRKKRGGTTSRDVPLARSLFVDLDNVSVDDGRAQVEKARLPTPSLTICSGHGLHLYWRLAAPIQDLGRWTTLQKRLIRLLDKADSSVHDPARLMRLPGFLTVTGKPAPCHIVETTDHRYELRELEAPLPPVTVGGGRSAMATNGHISKPTGAVTRHDKAERLRRAIAFQERFETVGPGERNTKSFHLATAVTEKFDLGIEDLHEVTNKYNERLSQPLDEGELREVTEKAFRHVHRKNKQVGTALAEGPPLISHSESDEPTRSLDEYRGEMKKHRLESLQRPPTLYFDGSTTGAGKSTADLAAMRVAGRSITLLPTHGACEEQAEKLRDEGLDAAAYPALDETTCLRFGNNKKPDDGWVVQSAGLDIGTALCAGCPLFSKCDYQERRDHASKAKHAIATHARAAHGNFAIVKDRHAAFIHEDCRDLLRPTFHVSAKRLSNTPHIGHLRDIVEIAEEAVSIAERMGDDEKVEYAAHLYHSTKQLVEELKSDDLLADVEKADLDDKLEQCVRVKHLTLNEPRQRPDRLDLLLYQAVRATGIDPNGEALRLCLFYANGELESLCVVIDDTFTKGKKHERQFYKSLVGVRRVDLPDDLVVWLEDATTNAQLLAELARRPVFDRTPGGRLRQVVQPVQYPFADVTLQTSGNIVRGLVRGLIAHHIDKQKIGIITHQVHLPSLKKLEPFWQDRIERLDYFRSGNDRASNRWLECDLLLILGTPRVPPSAVRQGLIQLGMVVEAGMDGRWSKFAWEGKALDGKSIQVEGSGYQTPSWRRVHHILVRSLLLQAIGRGRGVLKKGIPVVVVSNEPLGLPFMANALSSIKDSVGNTFMAVAELTDKSPTYNTVGKMSVTTGEVALASGCSTKQAGRHLNLLSSFGLLAKKGQRGGWTLNPALSA